MKYIKLINVILFLLLTSSCVSSKKTKQLPIESFVKVNVRTKLKLCFSTARMSFCEEKVYYRAGSGSVIRNEEGHSFVLTAGHVCVTEIDPKISSLVSSIETDFILINKDKDNMTAKIHSVSKKFLEGTAPIDLCLLKTDSRAKTKAIDISLFPPRIGDTVYNLAAPGGFFIPPSVPIFSGLYSGDINSHNSLYTIPAIGGSSGSPILNKNGKLVGVLFAANLELHHLSIAVEYKTLVKFLKENLN